MAKNIKRKTIWSIATCIGFFGGMRLYLQERRKSMEIREKEREKRWASLEM